MNEVLWRQRRIKWLSCKPTEKKTTMNITERRFLERLAASLEDEQQVDKAYVPPMGRTRAYLRGYQDGARMQAKAAAMAIRGLIGQPPELRPGDVGYAELILGDQTKGIDLCDPAASLSIAEPTDKVDAARIKKRGLR